MICSAALHQEFIGDRLIKDFVGSGSILRADLQFHTTDEVGDKPVEANHVVIGERALDAGRFKTTLGKQSFGKIAEFADGDELLRFVPLAALSPNQCCREQLNE